MKTTLIYFIIVFSLMLGAYINSITPKAVAYEAPRKSFPIIIESRKTWTDDTIKKAIRANLPEIFVKIALCESDLTPNAFNDKTRDYGILQVNEKVWSDWYTKEGLDPYNVDDAITIAKHIYKVQGLSAWSASSKCWSK